MDDIIKTLKKIRSKWLRAINKEHKYQEYLREKYPGKDVPGESYGKSIGVDIGYSSCSHDINKLIKQLETK